MITARSCRRLAALLLVAVAAVPLSAADPAGPDPAAVDAAVREALAAWQVPGAAVVVVRGDEAVVLRGYGTKVLGRDEPVTPDTLFPMASCSKSFITAAMAALADDGRIGWDDPVRKHLPAFKLADPVADANVTLRDLVTHRTGVGSHDLLWYHSPWGPEEIVRRVGRLPPRRPFRSGFEYQSAMFTAAGLAVTNAAGEPWPAFVRRRLTGPLGMTGVRFDSADAARAPDRPTGYRRDPLTGRTAATDWYAQPEPNAAGSVYCTARDLARWLSFHLGEGSFAGRRLVSAANLRQTHTPQVALPLEGEERRWHPETNLMSYAMGWVAQDYRGHLLVSHAGIIDGFRTHLMLAPNDGWGVAVLSNLHATRMNLALSNRLTDLVLGLPARDWNARYLAVVREADEAAREARRQRELLRAPDTRPTLPPEAYAGTYEDEAYGRARVRAEGGGLSWEWGGFRGKLAHYHYDSFELHNELLADPLVSFRVNEGKREVEALEAFGVTFRRVK
jgi:CubicO group peptidase (beta-lactamase class C family)